MKRDQLDYVQFDVDFFNKPKIRALEYEFGAKALLVLTVTLCDLGRATNAEMHIAVYYSTCKRFEFDIKIADDLLKYLIENDILSYGTTNTITNSRIKEDQEKIAGKRDKWRERQSKNRDKGANEASVTRDNSVTLNTEDLNTEDLNNKIKKEKPKPEVLVFPPKLDNHECRNAWNAWLEHKKARGERYKSVQSQQQKLKEWAEAPEEFIAAINFSMGNNWAGIFAKRDGKYAKAQDPQRKLSPTELSIQAAQRISDRINAGKSLFLEDSKK